MERLPTREPPSSNFGPLAKNYDQIRFGYPNRVYETLKALLHPDAHVLDVGCGTGISTRELEPYFHNITGFDVDEGMLSEAKVHNDHIPYLQGDIRSTEFANASFDLVSAFSAFHWFTDPEDIKEIYRILKPNGIFCTVNKIDTNDLRPMFKTVLEKLGVPVETSIKTGAYNPKTLMEAGGFVDVMEDIFEHIEWYDLEGALLLMQSWNAWSFLTDEQKASALTDLRRAYQTLCDSEGRIARTLEIKMVTGKKPA